MIELLATLEPPDPEPPAPGRTVHILFVGVGFTTVAYASYGDFRRDAVNHSPRSPTLAVR
jgi:hypothetical protein